MSRDSGAKRNKRKKKSVGNGQKVMVWLKKGNSRKRVPARSLNRWLSKGWRRD